MSAIDRPLSQTSVRPWSLRRTLILAFGAVALLGLFQVIQTSGATSTGYSIRRLEQERLDWSAKVHRLETEVAALTSLERVERQARGRLGMVPAREILYLEVDVSPTQHHLVPRRFLTSEPSGGDGGAPWWQALFEFLPFD